MKQTQQITRFIKQRFNSMRLRFGRFTDPVCHHDPASIMVFVTNRCNFRCNTCPFTQKSPWSPPKDVPDVSLSLFEKILDHYKGATMVGIVGGEPLLHPDLAGLIRLAAQKKMVVNLSTNGSLLTEERIRELLSLPLGYINISLDAVNAEEFYRLRGGSPETFKKVTENAALLGSIRRSISSKVQFFLSFVTDQHNLNKIPDCFRIAKKMGADTVFCQSVLSYQCSTVTSGDAILWDEPSNRSYLSAIEVPKDIQFVPPVLVPHADHDSCQCVSCIHPFKLMAFDGAGNLSPCCVIPPHHRFGNFSDDVNCWRSGSEMQRFRLEMLHDEPASEEICIRCWERYSLGQSHDD